jgi:hypothetical protein
VRKIFAPLNEETAVVRREVDRLIVVDEGQVVLRHLSIDVCSPVKSERIGRGHADGFVRVFQRIVETPDSTECVLTIVEISRDFGTSLDHKGEVIDSLVEPSDSHQGETASVVGGDERCRASRLSDDIGAAGNPVLGCR